MTNSRSLELQLTLLLNEVKDALPPNDTKLILEFINHNECGLAYETLCTQIYEYDIHISSEFFDKIFSIGKLLEIEPFIWMPIKELVLE